MQLMGQFEVMEYAEDRLSDSHDERWLIGDDAQ